MPDPTPAPTTLRESPLRTLHEQLGARMVPFAGWRMPVQYAGIVEEHTAVREHAGVFDISHMGQLLVAGASAGDWLNRMLTNDVARLAAGQGQYTLLLNASGGVIDDLILYRTGADAYLLVVNASMTSADADWLRAHLPGGSGISLDDRSAGYAGMAVQGPETARIARSAIPGVQLPPRNGIVDIPGDSATPGLPCLLCRTGYTGEDGFELFCPAEQGAAWLQRFLDAGATPCGLGARDTLRLEMGYPLNGADLTPDRTPLEAGLGYFVALDKGDFIGRNALAHQKATGTPSRLHALKTLAKGPPPRAHYPVWLEDEKLGETCSGGISPSTGAGIAMAYLPTARVSTGDVVELEIRGRRFPAEIVKKPFYNRRG